MNLNKRKSTQINQLLEGVLNVPDSDVVVVRRKGCGLLFANGRAKDKIQGMGVSATSCKLGFSKNFPQLCLHCPLEGESLDIPVTAELENEGKIFSVTACSVEWLDDKPATAFTLRDITLQKTVEKRLYRMAYIDQLTEVPNRQKFREDFDAIEEEITAERLWGVVCIFDLDNFKGINDTYGHNTGDVMLRRLTEHLENDPNFCGHIYRLGGDEFVLLYSQPAEQYANEAQLREYYDKLLDGAFRSYTMPNIELACTISMGVALFPKHGNTASDLMRKADIALYQAKADGRNQKVIFEDRFDTAKRFKDLFINIQPILDGKGHTYGYELYDREVVNRAQGQEQVVNLSGIDRTVDALGLGEMEDNARYYIACSPQLMNPAVLKNLPREKFVVQIPLPNQVAERDMQTYRDLKANGYLLAFTGANCAHITPDVLAIADYCKLPVSAITNDLVGRLIRCNPQKSFVVTGVDTYDQYDRAKKAGFTLFQGFYFNESRPAETRKTKEINPLKVNYFRLLQLTSTDSYVNFKEISDIISSDVALSYRLLKLLNSAALGMRNIPSITLALAYLGEVNLKKWIGMLALRGIVDDKPLELVRMSLIRARFGELLAPYFNVRRDPKHIFLLGMLSLLHIATEQTKEELLEELPVADDIRASLLSKTGVYSGLLAFFTHYEYANWEEVSRFADENNLDPHKINDCYITAIKWVNDLMNGQM